MSSDIPTPLFAFDVLKDGQATPADIATDVPGASNGYRWVHFDLETPGLEAWCATNLPASATRALLAQKTRPRVDQDEDGLLLTLRGINLNEGFDRADMVSLRMWAARHLVVSVRRQRVFAAEATRDQILADNAPPSPSRLIARITELLVDRVEDLSIELEDHADKLEAQVYDEGSHALSGLPELRRTVIKMRRHIGPLSDALHALGETDDPVLPSKIRTRLRDTANRAARALDELSEVRERIDALSEHLDFLQAAKLSRNGYLISVAAAIFLPLGFFTGLFGVNVGGMPGIDSPYAFAILTGSMVVAAVLLYVIFRLQRWF